MKRPSVIAAILLATGLTILSGIMHGRYSNRWGPPAEAIAAAQRFKDVPREFGNWRLKSTQELSDIASKMLQPAGSFIGTFENLLTADVVDVTLLIGPPGNISVHTPEVCFGSKFYQQLGERQKRAVNGQGKDDDEFWWMDYKLTTLGGAKLRVYYAWSFGDRWMALKNPRLSSAGHPYLYKIQLTNILPPGYDGSASDDACLKFLEDFVPAVRKIMVSPTDLNQND